MKRIISLIVVAAIMAGMSFPVSAESESDWWCEICENLGGNPDCDCYMLGDVNGDGYVDFLDANEINKYLSKLDSVILHDTLSYKAACILNNDYKGGAPGINDLLVILKFMVGLPAFIPFDGNNPNRLPIAKWNYYPRNNSVRAEIDIENEVINYILTEDYAGEMIFYNKIEYDSLNAISDVSGNSRLPGDSYGFGYFNRNTGLNTFFLYLVGEYETEGKIPAGTVIMTHDFNDGTSEIAHGIKILDVTSVEGSEIYTTESNIEVTVKDCEVEGCGQCGTPARAVGDVDGDGVITIKDAVEILRYLAKVESVIDTGGFAYKAACVSGGDSPSINDALAIMKILAKV
ncbi:MAG: hypothetical protein FWF82_03145 [Oscillospiraceae bacterium]|nr:hypothetical protein [Oscillospiraceae bacterium]